MIIGIESSCDESAVAIFDPLRGIIFEEVASQISLHSEYGGVVPELAAREHLKNFVPLLHDLKEHFSNNIDYIAYTSEPGLPGCVHVGRAVAESLSLLLNIQTVPVNHLYGHLFSPFIPVHAECVERFDEKIKSYLPFIGLLVSGGNTIAYEVDESLSIKILAATVDDAAGEAFDKGAKLLGMPYPGGALIEKLAINGNFRAYDFPRAFSHTKEMKFSFSGLKTSLRYFIEKFDGNIEDSLPDICASYQAAIVDALAMKLDQILEERQYVRAVCVSGGVSNNNTLRSVLELVAKRHKKEFLLPLRKHTGDNAAMIAFVGFIMTSFGLSSV